MGFTNVGGLGYTQPAALNAGSYLIVDSNVRCTGRFTSATINGLATKRHDGGALVSGIGTGSITITLITCTPSANPAGYRTSELYVDGEWKQSLVTTVDNNTQDFVYDLGAGNHYFEICEAINYNPSSPTFTSVYQVTGAVAIQSGRTAPSTRIGVWADSKATGVNLPAANMRDGWFGKLRQMYPNAWCAMDAIPGRKSGDDTAAVFGAECAALVSGGTTRKVVVEIGYNDYGNNVSAATFQTNLAAQLDNAHGVDAGLQFIILGPIVATVETANGAGNTLDDYRTACSTICGTRGAFTTYVNAKTWITTSQLSDGVHPNAIGCDIIAAQIRALI